ncbi:carbon storage regulator [Pseudomonadota bacterium]
MIGHRSKCRIEPSYGTRSIRILILTRGQNESVIIDGDIKVTVLSDKHGQVKLGIEAPDDVGIWLQPVHVFK